jgi:hypothetical protein
LFLHVTQWQLGIDTMGMDSFYSRAKIGAGRQFQAGGKN